MLAAVPATPVALRVMRRCADLDATRQARLPTFFKNAPSTPHHRLKARPREETIVARVLPRPYWARVSPAAYLLKAFVSRWSYFSHISSYFPRTHLDDLTADKVF